MYFWVDLEMTGLNLKADRIIEAAVVITDLDLNILEKYTSVVRQEGYYLSRMDEWNTNAHTASGLINEVPFGKPISKVEDELLALADKYFKGRRIKLMGSAVFTDHQFIEEYMPKFAERLHFRVIDIATFRDVLSASFDVNYQNENSHRALDDILGAIEELRFYFKFLNRD